MVSPIGGMQHLESLSRTRHSEERMQGQLKTAARELDRKAVGDPGEAESDPQRVEALRQAAQGFEAIFVRILLREMRNTVPESDLLDGGFARDVFEDLLDEKRAEQIAGSQGLGLGEMVFRQLKDHL